MSPIACLPVGFFGAAMGLSGLCVAWRLAAVLFGLPLFIAEAIGFLAVLAFLLIAAGYVAKLAFYPARVAAEWNHPVIGPLFSTIPISLLLLPIVLRPYAPGLATLIWILGAASMAGFTTYIVARWLTRQPAIDHAAPTWFVPVIGALNIPAAGMFHDVPAVHQFYLLAVGIGFVFAFVLFTLVFARLVFRPPMPAPLTPSLAILMAPFGVGFIGYTQTIENIDLFASMLLACGLFMVIVLLPVLVRAARRPPFRLSWWALSFPLASVVVSSLRYAIALPIAATLWVAASMLALGTASIFWVLFETLHRLARGDLFDPEIEAAAQAEAAQR